MPTSEPHLDRPLSTYLVAVLGRDLGVLASFVYLVFCKEAAR